MNKGFILFNLKEAQEAIDRLLEQIQASQEYSFEELEVDIAHVYQHVNTAWNARAESDTASNQCSQEDFDRWRQFPSDLKMS